VTTDGSVSAGSVPVWKKVSGPQADRKTISRSIKMESIRFNKNTPFEAVDHYLYSMKIGNICQANRRKRNVFVGDIPDKLNLLEIINKKHGEISLQKIKSNT
jgi:hypothetical protein